MYFSLTEDEADVSSANESRQAAQMYRQRRHISVEDTVSLSSEDAERSSPAINRRQEFAQQVSNDPAIHLYTHSFLCSVYMCDSVCSRLEKRAGSWQEKGQDPDKKRAGSWQEKGQDPGKKKGRILTRKRVCLNPGHSSKRATLNFLKKVLLEI